MRARTVPGVSGRRDTDISAASRVAYALYKAPSGRDEVKLFLRLGRDAKAWGYLGVGSLRRQPATTSRSIGECPMALSTSALLYSRHESGTRKPLSLHFPVSSLLSSFPLRFA